MGQLKRYNGTQWENVGGNIAPKTVQTTSDTDTYSCNYINDLVVNETYELTNTPSHSDGTNVYSINKMGNIITFNCDSLWFNSITANTWLDLGNIPSAIFPTTEKATCGVCSNGASGNIEGVGRIIVQATGLVRIKSNFSRSGLTGVSFSISWVLD